MPRRARMLPNRRASSVYAGRAPGLDPQKTQTRFIPASLPQFSDNRQQHGPIWLLDEPARAEDLTEEGNGIATRVPNVADEFADYIPRILDPTPPLALGAASGRCATRRK